MADFALQRKNMVDSQVRPSDITDRRIIRAMLDVPREAFCPAAVRATAYRDEMLAVNDHKGRRARYAVAPRVLALMIQALELEDSASVLEIGTATGYGAAVLSKIAARVIAVEADAELAIAARAALAANGAANVAVVDANLTDGHAAAAPYDAILINGCVQEVPRAVLDQLKDGGRLVAVMANDNIGRLNVWRRVGGTFDRRVVSDAAAPMLPGFEKPATFVF
jgi:protein-L-isoaspartate(D-aspartate) O-methyltransferase